MSTAAGPARDSAAGELDELLERPMAPIHPDVLDAIERGPIDPADALAAGDVHRMLEPGDLLQETGWCNMPDGSGYAAVRTPMPGVTGDMLDWWFAWHPHDAIRYRVWYPGAHAGISIDPAAVKELKPYWGTVHHPVEDIGLGVQHLRIRFLDPVSFGFPQGVLHAPRVSTVVCGLAGDDRRRVWHTRMCHFARSVDTGIELRSRFWIGSELRLLSSARIAEPVNRVLGLPAVRRRAIPRRAPLAMARHCAAEYANLAALLPVLHARYGDLPDPPERAARRRGVARLRGA
ncbi:MAG: DAPG hydrolase family protein [Solirubrobacteraceae bacterium]